MTPEEFDIILEDRIQKIRDTLKSKGNEYGRVDRLHNFKRAAKIGNCTPEEALKGMWIKHLVSVMDMIEGFLEPTDKMIDEKIGDAIIYAILLEAVFKEKSLDAFLVRGRKDLSKVIPVEGQKIINELVSHKIKTRKK